MQFRRHDVSDRLPIRRTSSPRGESRGSIRVVPRAHPHPTTASPCRARLAAEILLRLHTHSCDGPRGGHQDLKLGRRLPGHPPSHSHAKEVRNVAAVERPVLFGMAAMERREMATTARNSYALQADARATEAMRRSGPTPKPKYTAHGEFDEMMQ